jgi:predicted RecB family nuclease
MSFTLSPSSITRLSVPSKCERRTWLRYNSDVEPSPDGPFQVLLQDLGIDHERQVLGRLQGERGEFVDLDSYDNPNALAETIEAVEAGRNIYQGKFECPFPDAPDEVMLQGLPDFLYLDDDGKTWVIADAKLARKVYMRDGDGAIVRKGDGGAKIAKEYIVLQLQFYGWMFTQLFGGLDFRLLVFTGSGGEEEIEYDGGEGALQQLRRILEIKALPEEPWEQVGNSKCSECSYNAPHCKKWGLETKNLGLIPEIDAGEGKLGPRLVEEGFTSYDAIYERFAEDVEGLAQIKSQKATIEPARRVMENVESWVAGIPIRRRDADGEVKSMDTRVTDHDRYVMFDLEGVPPDLDNERTKIYLWGMQVFGFDDHRGEFEYALARSGDDCDKNAWFEFLEISRKLLDENPGILFAHWHDYERQRIEEYLGKYGDDKHETAEGVLAALLDLLPIAKDQVAVPLIGYSLKFVEGLPEVGEVSGFSRADNEISKGDESVAGYIEAVETDDETRREELIQSLLAYNQQDLEATWAVQQWLRSLA